MNLTDLFTVFVNWQTGVLCLGVFVFTYVIRQVMETLWIGAKTNRYWTGIFLPLGAIGTGIILGICSKKFPWPMPIAGSVLARAMYGSICGLASGWVYTQYRKLLKDFGKGSAGPGPSPTPEPEPPAVPDPEPPPGPKA